MKLIYFLIAVAMIFSVLPINAEIRTDMINWSQTLPEGANITLDGGYILNLENKIAEYDVVTWIDEPNTIAAYRNGTIILSSTDHTDVLRAALAATPTNGSIFIGPGVYDDLRCDILCTTATSPTYLHYNVSLPITRNLHIRGAGINATILKMGNGQYNATHNALIMYVYAPPVDGSWGTGYTSFSLEDMTFDGNKAAQTPAFYDGAGLFLAGSMRYNGVYRNLEFRDSPNSGVYFGNHGAGWGNHELYENIFSHDNAGIGLNFDTITDCQIIQCHSERDSTVSTLGNLGIYWMSAAYQSATKYDNSVAYGLSSKGSSIYLHGLRGVTISGLYYKHDGSSNSAGVTMRRCNLTTITDSFIWNELDANHNGIYVASTSENNTVKNSIIRANRTLYLDGAGKFTASGCNLYGGYMGAIVASGTTTFDLLGCDIQIPSGATYQGSILTPAVVNALGSISSYNASFYKTGTLNHKATLNLGVTD